MSNTIKIAGREVELAWTNEVQKRFAYRAALVDHLPKFADLANPRKAAAAYAIMLWLLLPPEEHARHATPEDLFAVIDHDTEAKAICDAVIAVLTDMLPTAEKKTTSNSKRLQQSNLASIRVNGKKCIRR